MFVKNFLGAMASTSAAAAAALTVTATTQNTEFDAMANTNMVVYWVLTVFSTIDSRLITFAGPRTFSATAGTFLRRFKY